MVALRLDRFLQEIEVDRNRIRPDHLNGPLRPFDPVVAELDNTEICYQECMGCFGADHRERIGKGRVLKRSPLGADAHSDPIPFCSPCKTGIRIPGTGMTTGHR